MPDGGGEGEEPCRDAHGDAGFGASVVAFEGELAFEGPVDRFDDLAQRPQEPCAGPRGLGSGGGTRTANRLTTKTDGLGRDDKKAANAAASVWLRRGHVEQMSRGG